MQIWKTKALDQSLKLHDRPHVIFFFFSFGQILWLFMKVSCSVMTPHQCIYCTSVRKQAHFNANTVTVGTYRKMIVRISV